MIVSRNRRVVRQSAKNLRTRRVLCEALEDRQLMSLTLELRAADGSSSATVNTVGQTITLNVLAVITAGTAGPNDTNISTASPSTFGIQDVKGSILSSAPYQSAVAGNLSDTLAMGFSGPGAEPGVLQDLNGDGNIDIGTNTFTAATNDEFQPRGNSEVTTGTVVGSSKEIVLATVTYTVTNLHAGGETDISFRPFPSAPGEYYVADWFDGVSYFTNTGQGHYASEQWATLSAGTPFVITDPALVVPPTANPDTASVVRNTPTKISVLTNDTFVRPPDDTSIVITTAPAHGTAIPQTDGSVLYTPATGYLGTDTFDYTVDDTDGRVSNATPVTITVTPPPPPVAVAVTATTLRNQPDTINVLSSDTVTSPATIVPADVEVVTVPTHGTAIPQTDGTILYTPTSGYTGADSFTYTVQDSNGEVSSPGTVSVTVTTPTPPTAGAVSATTTAGAPVTITVLSSDTTPQGTLAPASVTVVTQGANGTAVAQADGTIIYTPVARFTGSDSFTYTVADNFGDVSAPATVSLTVTPGTPPVANPVTAPAISGQTNTINVIGSATSGAPLVPSSVAVVTPPSNGTATVNTSDGSIAYVPNAGFVGTDTFTYTVGNTNLDTSAPATVSVDVGTTISSTKGAAHSLTFTDAAGGLETVTLNRGSAELFFSGTGGSVTVGKNLKAVVTGTNLELSGITLSGTTAASSFSIRGSVKTPVTIGGITDASPMGSIVAPNAEIIGTGIGGNGSPDTVVLDSLGTLNVKSISTAGISIGAALPGHFSLTTGAVADVSLTSAVPVTAIRATSWTSSTTSPQLTAPSIGTLTITGAFDEALSLTQTTVKTPALRSARITGGLDGSLTTSAPIGSLYAGSIASSWIPNLGAITSLTVKAGGFGSNLTAGAIGTMLVTGDLSGNITAASAKVIHVTGGITNPNGLTVSIAGALGQLVAGGTISDSTIHVGGNISALSAAALNTSTVYAGVASSVNIATAAAANLGSATIGSIRLTGRTGDQFTASDILASRINAASLGSVTTANSGAPFGIAAKYIGSFAGVFAGSILHLGHAALSTQALLASSIEQQGVTFGDFEILIEA